MTPPLAAHLHLMETIGRERIHTHTREYTYEERCQGKRVGDLPDSLVAEVKHLHLCGLTQQRVMRELQMGCKLYVRIRDELIARTPEAERVKQIETLDANGMHYRGIAAVTGFSRGTVLKHLKRLRAA